MQRACSACIVIAAITGCASAVSDAETDDEAGLAAATPDGFDGAREARAERAPPRPAGQHEAALVANETFDGSTSAPITSTATAGDGSRYVAGVFSGSIRVGGFELGSHGGTDVFVARILPDGTVVWAQAVGSAADESNPKVSFSDGRVKLVAMTNGAVDCGQGPLNTWSSETFFLCTFGTDGAPINGGSFPTGRR
jgi:hypothetical protein